MANHKFKRSTRSATRGKGKNHSVNKEKSHVARKKQRRAKHKKAENADFYKRLKLARRLFMSGVCEDYSEATTKAFSVNKNFFDNPNQWFDK